MATAISPFNAVPTDVDVAVVGAGPAGLAATVAAAERGATVALLDLNPALGGQYWRHPPEAALAPEASLYHDWSIFQRLADAVAGYRASGRCQYLPEHSVWSIGGPGPFSVYATAGERERSAATITAQAVVVATGAYDRALPFPGWDLPGVMSAGAAQALAKGARTLPGRRVVVAGTGPFLLPVATGLLSLGGEIAAVIEANDPLRYLAVPERTARSWRKWPEAAGYLRTLLHHRVPLRRRQAVIEAFGDDRLRGVRICRLDENWRPVGKPTQTLSCDVLAVGYGFVPNVDLLAALGCEVGRDPHGSLVARVADDQETSVSGVFAAGETTGVGGAQLALAEGELAGAAAASRVGRAGPAHPDARRRRERHRRFAELLDLVHPIGTAWPEWLTDDTLVCRCEEVPVGALRKKSIGLAVPDLRTAKLLTRVGMGWCQGRVCGPAVRALCGPTGPGLTSVERRTLAQPVPLGVLASLDEPDPPASGVEPGA